MFKTILTVGVFLLAVASALDEAAVKEKRCLLVAPEPFKGHDTKWASEVPKWYFNYADKLHFYRIATYVAGEPIADIKEDDLYYNGCFSLSWGTGFPSMGGLGKTNVVFPFKSISPGISEFIINNQTVQVYTTLSDNKTYQFFYHCWQDGEASWAVTSTEKVLEAASVEKIREHVKALGFQDKFFTQIRYETCPAN